MSGINRIPVVIRVLLYKLAQWKPLLRISDEFWGRIHILKSFSKHYFCSNMPKRKWANDWGQIHNRIRNRSGSYHIRIKTYNADGNLKHAV
jgi:hypothetical protein